MSESTKSDAHILIVEDSGFNSMMLQKILTDLGLGFSEATNGKEGLDIFGKTTVDLILMDIEMPVMDGITAAKKIRNDFGERGKTIPIVAMTGHLNSDKHKEILQAGMNDYIIKPFSFEVLRQKVKSHLTPRKSQSDDKQSFIEPSLDPSVPFYNLSYLKEFTQQDADLLKNLIHYFVNHTPAVVVSMKTSFENRDWEALVQLSHKFASEVAFLGNETLQKDVHELENLATERTNPDRMNLLIGRIGLLCDAMLRQLNVDFPAVGETVPIVLLCEDDFMLSKTIEFKLTKDGFRVISVGNGKAGVDFLQQEHVDLIITDMLMPYMSGLELIVYVREQLKLLIPIMVLSRIGLEKTVIQALDLGADDYIVKPFSPGELGARVKKILKKNG